MRCDTLNAVVESTVNALYGDTDFTWLQKQTGLTHQQILETKCGLVCAALKHIYKFHQQNKIHMPAQLFTNHAYMFDLEGITRNGKYSKTDHEFIVMHMAGNWWLLDSYIGCRKFTCRTIDAAQLLRDVYSLRKRFNERIWRNLTGCSSLDQVTYRVHARIYEYNYKNTLH